MDDSITYRPGTSVDSYAVFRLFEETLADLLPRIGIQLTEPYDDPEKLARTWESRRGLYEHLAVHNDQFWVAEMGEEVVGFARSLVHDDLRELTEFFVKPGLQSRGVGKRLLDRAFPLETGMRRSIIATTDLKAQVRYLKSGVYPRFPLMYFGKTPQVRSVDESSLIPVPVAAVEEDLAEFDRIDSQVLTYRRRSDHRFLLQDRAGILYHRDGQVVGYGYVGSSSGPFAFLDPTDFPSALAHAETFSAHQGNKHFGLEVPMTNQHAVDYLLENGFWMDAFIAFLMTDQPFGQFDRYIITSPPFIL